MAKQKPDDEYTEAEAEKRFVGALKAGLATTPAHLKDKPKVRDPGAKKPGRPSKSGA